jgi:hypothetical protein
MDGSLKLLSKDHKDTVSPSLRLLFVGYCLRYTECSSQLSQKNREGQKFFQLNHLHINTITVWKLTDMLRAYKGEYMQITVIRKSDNSVITRIFEDEEGIKEITDDDYEVLIEKDSN